MLSDIHTAEDWDTIFLLLKTAGAGLVLEKNIEEDGQSGENSGQGEGLRPSSRAQSENDLSIGSRSDTESVGGNESDRGGNDSDRGYTSENEIEPELPQIHMVKYLNNFKNTQKLVGPIGFFGLVFELLSIQFCIE